MKKLAILLLVFLMITLIFKNMDTPTIAGGGNDAPDLRVTAYLRGTVAPIGAPTYTITPGGIPGIKPVCLGPPPVGTPPGPKPKFIFEISNLPDDARKYRLTKPVILPKGFFSGELVKFTPKIRLNLKGNKPALLKELNSQQVLIQNFFSDKSGEEAVCFVASRQN